MTLQAIANTGLGYAPVIRTFDQVPTANPAWTGDAPDPASSNVPYRIYNIGNQQPVELLRYIEVLEQCPIGSALFSVVDNPLDVG